MQANGMASCTCCGIEYSQDSLRLKFTKKDNSQDGEMGTNEKENLLKNVETFLSLGKYSDARKVCDEIIKKYPEEKEFLLKSARSLMELGANSEADDLYNEISLKYPDDYRGWWGIFESGINADAIAINHLICRKYRDATETAIKLNPCLEEKYFSILQMLLDTKRLYWSNRSLVSGSVYAASWKDIETLAETNPLRIAYEKGKPYVQKLNSLAANDWNRVAASEYLRNVIGKSINAYGGYSAMIGKTLFFEIYDDGTYTRTTQIVGSIDELIYEIEAAVAKVQAWKSAGKCPHCGGEYHLFKSWDSRCKRCRKLWR